MTRLLAAVGLAVALHIVLLGMNIPDQKTALPQVSGSRRVTVTLARSMPQAEALEETVPEETAEPQPVRPEPLPPEIEKQVKEIETPPLPKPVIPLEPVNRKRELFHPGPAEEMPRLNQSTAADSKPAAAESERAMGPAAAPEPAPAGGRLVEAAVAGHDNPPPSYPPLARRRGWEGRVLLEVEVLADGAVVDVSIRESSPHRLLDEAALKAVRGWQFAPGTLNGQRVAMKILVPVNFILQEKP